MKSTSSIERLYRRGYFEFPIVQQTLIFKGVPQCLNDNHFPRRSFELLLFFFIFFFQFRPPAVPEFLLEILMTIENPQFKMIIRSSLYE